MSTKHYHVLMGLRGGFLPDVNDACRTMADTLACARFWIDTCREAGDSIRGSDGFWEVRPQGQERFTNAIEITDACYADCDLGEES